VEQYNRARLEAKELELLVSEQKLKSHMGSMQSFLIDRKLKDEYIKSCARRRAMSSASTFHEERSGEPVMTDAERYWPK
jgi:hypothetical protein